MHRNLSISIVMLNTFSGQILRVSPATHVLVYIKKVTNIIAPMAIESAIDFVKVHYQHTAYITGH